MKKSNKKIAHFSYEDAVKVETLLGAGYGISSIAKQLNRSKSSVSEEVSRNLVRGIYLAKKAHLKTYQRYWRARHDHLKVALHNHLRRFVDEKLRRFWSPEGIAGRITYVETHLTSVGKIGRAH